MNREKRLLRNTIIYFVGNFCSKVLSVVLLPMYTIYLSTEQYGTYDLVMSLVAVVIPIITLSLQDGIYRHLLDERNQDEETVIISTGMIVILINIFLGTITYLWLVRAFNFKNKELILLQTVLLILFNVYGVICRGLKRNFVYSITGILSSVIMISLNIYLIIICKMNIEALFISNIISYIFCIIYMEIKVKLIKRVKVSKFNMDTFKEFVGYSLPLIPNVLSWWVMNLSDRFILKHFLGNTLLGVYAASNKFPAFVTTLNSIFFLAWQESAITEYKSEDRDVYYSKMFNSFMIFQTMAIILLMSVTRIFSPIFFNNEFTNAYLYIPLLYLAALYNGFSTFLGTGYQCAKKTNGVFYSSLIGAILNIVINIVCIPIIGVQGASLATFISFFVMFIFRVIDTRKFLKIKIDYTKLIISNLLILIATIIYYKLKLIGQLIFLFIVCMTIVIKNFSLIKNIILKYIKFNI